MTEDVAVLRRAGRARPTGPIVELAVGNGRVAIPVARATGRRVIGIDLSPAMLAQARERAAAAGVELELREGDMRDLELDEPAALIYCPFRGAAAPADLGRPPTRVRARRRVAAAGRALRVERVRLRPAIAAEARRAVAGRRGGSAHASTRFRPTAASTSRSRAAPAISLWWATRTSGKGCSTSPGWRSRRCTAGSTGGRSTRRAGSSSGSRAGPRERATTRSPSSTTRGARA